ncbi:MAG: hypothetical protein HGA95_04220, partial [Caldiserica bacterium]|nr:hypothetical protein [Caldisericota bacterium]
MSVSLKEDISIFVTFKLTVTKCGFTLDFVKPKNIDDLISDFEDRLALAKNDTQEAQDKQAKKGKLTARDRIRCLLDANSFVETDALIADRLVDHDPDAYVPGEGVVTGYGSIDGRLVFVYSQDFTVVGGSLSEMHGEKIAKVMDMAAKSGAPVVGINDSGGARVQDGVDALSGYGKIFYRNSIYSGVVPQISLILGPSAGGAVYSPALTDFIFMVDGISNMFITGPQIIKAVTGEEVDKEKLGGSRTHTGKSGVAQFRYSTEADCFAGVRTLVSYLPQNCEQKPPRVISDNPNRVSPELNELVPVDPNKSYDVRKVIREIVDDGEFFEVSTEYAKNIVSGFARIDGYSIGIVANQPIHLAGCLDIDSSDKASKFIRTCDCFNIPLLNLVDVPGFLPGVAQEHGGIIRHGAKMLYAYAEATVPKITVILRKAYGGAYLAMCSRDMGADQVFAWPTAEIAVMGPDGAANIIFKKEISEAADPNAMRKQKIEEYKEKTAEHQKDKDSKVIWLYTVNKDEQLPFIELAQKRDYNVLVFNELLDSHFINFLESKKEIQLKRIDSASIDDLINKGEKKES